MCGVSVSHALKTEPLVSVLFIKEFRAEIVKHISHRVYFSRFKYIRLLLLLFYFISMKENANSAHTTFSDIVTRVCFVPTFGNVDLRNKIVYDTRHRPHRTHDLRRGSQDHHPSKNSVQETICCNSTSIAPDDGRIYPKHVKLRIH